MKRTYTRIHIQKKIYFICIVAFMASLFACKSSNTEVAIGSLSVYNVSPTPATYDIYVSGTKMNSVAIPFGGGVKYIQYTPGTYDVKFTYSGYTDNLYTKTGIGVSNGSYNSLYLIGKPGNFDALYLTDNFSGTAADKAYVRFINLSPDAPALDLAVESGSTLTNNKAYKAYSGFIAVDPGSKAFEIKETASGTVKATIAATTLAAANFYTIISRGLYQPSSPSEHPFSGQIITQQ